MAETGSSKIRVDLSQFLQLFDFFSAPSSQTFNAPFEIYRSVSGFVERTGKRVLEKMDLWT